MMRHLTLPVTLLAAIGLLAAPGRADAQGKGQDMKNEKAANPARATGANPHAMANNSWITLSGTVKEVRPDSFLMNYGTGVITVEMDDGDRDADAYQLVVGDEVTVSGMIDNDFFEKTTIEAGTVYVKKLGTTFFSSAMDEEGFLPSSPAYAPIYATTNPATYVTGTVASVSDGEFVLDTGTRELKVDIGSMPYNPLDDEGYQKVEKGDRVSVIGTIDWSLFEGRELMAESVIVLHEYGSGHPSRSE